MLERKSNFELLRIIAILLVLLLHADFFALGGPSVEDIRMHPTESFIRILIQSISIISVDVFVMISGWFGIKQSKKGISNLLFQTFYYLIIIAAIAHIFGFSRGGIETIKDIFMLNSSNWFIKAYLVLWILSPILNSYINTISQKMLKHTIIVYFAFQFIYGWLFPTSTPYFDGGYSPLTFIGLYLLARYIAKYKTRFSKYSNFTLFTIILVTICFEILTCMCSIFISDNQIVYGYILMTYISPSTILISSLIILLISRANLKSKFINCLAKSSFAVYLIFVNPNILSIYRVFLQTFT